jgi:hypothetical protein
MVEQVLGIGKLGIGRWELGIRHWVRLTFDISNLVISHWSLVITEMLANGVSVGKALGIRHWALVTR